MSEMKRLLGGETSLFSCERETKFKIRSEEYQDGEKNDRPAQTQKITALLTTFDPTGDFLTVSHRIHA